MDTARTPSRQASAAATPVPQPYAHSTPAPQPSKKSVPDASPSGGLPAFDADAFLRGFSEGDDEQQDTSRSSDKSPPPPPPPASASRAAVSDSAAPAVPAGGGVVLQDPHSSPVVSPGVRSTALLEAVRRRATGARPGAPIFCSRRAAALRRGDLPVVARADGSGRGQPQRAAVAHELRARGGPRPSMCDPRVVASCTLEHDGFDRNACGRERCRAAVAPPPRTMTSWSAAC